MGRQTISVNSKILLAMLLAGDMPMRFNGRLLTSPQYPWLRSDRRLLRMLRYLHHKGYVVWEDTAATRLIKITNQGKLKSLLDAFDVDMSKKWDGKWRVVVYDIPEATSALRFQLIHQLHQLRFKKLQASVYISPFAFNDAALEYLRASGLMPFIRIMTVDRLDDDSDLREWYKLK